MAFPEPRVSVVIPLHNGRRYLGECLDSVLAQTFTDFELILVDDASTDDTCALVDTYAARDERVHLVRLPTNGGSSNARNRGIAEARGVFIACADQDDVWMPQRLERQVAAAEAEPDVLLWAAAMELVDDRGRFLGIDADGPTTDDEYRAMVERQPIGLMGPTFFFRKVIVEALGGYDPALPTVDDTELSSRFALKGPVRLIDEPLMRYRKHAEQVSGARFFVQAEGDRFLWDRAAHYRETGAMLELDEWRSRHAQLPRVVRARHHLADRGRFHLRRALYAWLAGNKLRAAGNVSLSILCSPTYLPRRAWSRRPRGNTR